MNPEIIKELQEHLPEGEKLIWTGRPKQGIIFNSLEAFLIPFFIICAIIFLYTLSEILFKKEFHIISIAMLVPFGVFILFVTAGRFVIDKKARKTTYYGLTDNFIIIKSGLFKTITKFIEIENLYQINYLNHKNGTGTVRIYTDNLQKRIMQRSSWFPTMMAANWLYMIPDAYEVYERIVAIRQEKLKEYRGRHGQ